MICNSIDRTIAIGDKRLDYKTIIFKVVEFLDNTIDGFPQFLSSSGFIEESEKRINEMLATYLNNCTTDFFDIESFRFSFIKDTTNKSSNYNPDIGVMLGNKMVSTSDSFFHIECKRLPARAGHEREYVHGKLGGIQRFKEGNHGKGLNYSAMVGYIQSGTIEDWHKKVNSWIDDLFLTNDKLSWEKNDRLLIRNNESRSKFISSHSRQDHQNTIILYHYWLIV
ncbi:MAG: hypothetical protein JW729_00580 [Bacteroidales bacterium]|nr:hypothetical protein [Bacteroidales bacterium]